MYTLKLALLEWSESISDGKIGFSMLKNHPVQIFGAIGAISGVWQHIVIFAWWHVHVTSRGSTYYNIFYRRNCSSNFRYQNKEINYGILIKYARDDIAWKLFWNSVTMEENKIQIFDVEFNGAWIENHLRVSSSKILNICCQTPLVALIAPKICTEWFFNMLNPNLPSELLSYYSSNTSFNIYEL